MIVRHDHTLTLTLAGFASDEDQNHLSFEVVSGPSSGLTVTENGALTYQPPTNYVGEVSFTYRAIDGIEYSEAATITFDVRNQSPQAFDDEYSLMHNEALVVSAADGLLANDFDNDFDDLFAYLHSPPTHGSVIVETDGSFVYIPSGTFSGEDHFQYVVTDGIVTATTVNVTLNIYNNTPIVRSEAYQVPKQGPLVVNAGDGLLANDGDLDGDMLTVSLISPISPPAGDFVLGLNGAFTFTPAQNFVGEVEFEYEVFDGIDYSETVTVTLYRDNTAPVGNPDFFTTIHGQSLNVPASSGLLVNDYDLDSADTLTIALVDGSFPGLELSADGSFTYEPDNGVYDTSFYYTVSDGIATSAPIRVDLKVTNSKPIANSDFLNVPHSRLYEITWEQLLANDVDFDVGETFTIDIDIDQPRFGSLEPLEDQTGYAYDPDPGFTGADYFTYTISDGVASSLLALVTIQVGNTAPVLAADTYSVNEDTTLMVLADGLGSDPDGVAANDFDADGDSLEIAEVVKPAHGTLTLGLNGGFTYIPDEDFTGVDSFTYSAFDGVTRREATVKIHVTPVNDVILQAPPTLIAHAGKPVVQDALEGAENVDDDTLTIEISTWPTHGELTFLPNGLVTYEADEEYVGLDGYAFRILENGIAGSPIAVEIDVRNAPPTTLAPIRTFSAFENTELTVTKAEGLLAWVNDPDGDSLEATIHSWPSGMLELEADGSFVYTPVIGFTGTDSFEVKVSDGLEGGWIVVPVTIYVSDVPIVVRGNQYRVLHDTIFSAGGLNGLLKNDHHPLGFPISVYEPQLVTAAHGSVALNTNGSFLYTPNAGFVGYDSFTYQVTDGAETSPPVQVAIEVYNAVPITNADNYAIHRGETLTVAASKGLLVNDYDDNRDAVTLIEIVDQPLNGPSHGTISLTSGGGFIGSSD